MNNGKSFLTLAQRLATQSSDNAALRSAISRAYYGAYNYGRHLLRQTGFSHIANKSRNHGEVWRYLQNCGEANVEKAGHKLADLESDRVKADYNMDERKFSNLKNIQFGLGIAQEIVSEFDHCITSSQKKEIVTQGMKQYERKISTPSS